MRALIALPWWVLVVGLLAVCFGTVALTRWYVHRWPEDRRVQAAALATTLMAVFGALFAFLSAFLITNEWTQHNTAETAIANESAAVARLAWAADTPDVARADIVAALARDVRRSVQGDWPAMADGKTSGLPSDRPFRDLQTLVRSQATEHAVEAPSATEMFAALDGVAQGRRDRLVAANRVMPTAIYAVVMLSGLALIVNAVIVAASRPWRVGRIIGILTVVVALDLALVLVISGPFRGSYVASSEPLARVGTQLDAGWFGVSGR